MSTHTHHGRVIPICRYCECEADLVVATEQGADPYCFPCGNAVMEHHGGREYPLESFYTREENHVSQFDPSADATFDLFDPDNAQQAWMSADNTDGKVSSVHVADHC